MVKAQIRTEGEFERVPWPDGETVLFRVIKAEPRLKYQSDDEYEMSLTVEALDGEVNGQWTFISVNNVGKDGKPNLVFDEDKKPLSKWAMLLKAIRPDFDIDTGDADVELKDLVEGVFQAIVEPANNPKYCRFLKFKPATKTQLAKANLGATVTEDLSSDIPF